MCVSEKNKSKASSEPTVKITFICLQEANSLDYQVNKDEEHVLHQKRGGLGEKEVTVNKSATAVQLNEALYK